MNQKKRNQSFYSIGLITIIVLSYIVREIQSFLNEDLILSRQSSLSHSIQISGQPICFMQTNDGRIMDLTRLCSKSPAQTQVEISGVFRQDNFLLGNVVNQTGKAVRNVRVNYEVIAPNGSVRDRGVAIAQPSDLTPGQTSIFEVDVEPGLTIRTTTVLWDE